jgi:hypothetical protein
MNVRQTLIVVAVFLLGVLTAGAFIVRPVTAEPKADSTAAGMYQAIPFMSAAAYDPNSAGHLNTVSQTEDVVVIDTATGQCWSNKVSGKPADWRDMGSPAKAK